MDLKRRALLFVASCFLFSSAMAAQNSESNQTWLPLIAQTAHHEPVIGLTAGSLNIMVGKNQATDLQLLDSAGLPLRLGVLVDASKSQNQDFPQLFAAAKQFAMSALRGPNDRAFLMKFDIASAATGWLTREQVSSVPEDARTGGGTALYDAIVSAVRNHLGTPDWSKPTRRVLVLISDGEDNESHVTLEAAGMEAVHDGVVIFAFDTNEKDSPGDKVMRGIAKRTGGKFFIANNDKAATKDFSELLEMMNGMYLVNFIATSDTHGNRDIRVKTVVGEKLEMSYPEKLGKQ